MKSLKACLLCVRFSGSILALRRPLGDYLRIYCIIISFFLPLGAVIGELMKGRYPNH